MLELVGLAPVRAAGQLGTVEGLVQAAAVLRDTQQHISGELGWSAACQQGLAVIPW